MKKMCILLCCVLILQLLCACGDKKEDFKEPVNFYYTRAEIAYNAQDAVLQAETREGYNYHDNVIAFLHAYLLGPESEELQTVVPTDVYPVSCSVEGSLARVVLSSQFSKLTGIKLTTACSAILMSLHDYAGIDTLHISAKESQLDDKDIFILTMDEIVLMDTMNSQNESER